MHWYIGPYVWSETADVGGGWVLPAGAVSGIDLRPVGQSAESGRRSGATSGRVLFASSRPPKVMPRDYRHLCTGGLDEPITARTAKRINRAASDGTLADAIMVALIHNADPSGDASPKPLMPGQGRQLKLCCGGHVIDRKLRLSGREWDNVRAVIRRDMDEVLTQVEAGIVSEEHSRKCLDYAFRKLRLRGDEWQDLLSADGRRKCRGPLPHSTTITESFNKADSSTLGPDLTWTETSTGLGVSSNTVVVDSGVFGEARAESDVSGSDHDAQVQLAYTWSAPGTGDNVRIIARFNASARTHYTSIIGESSGNGIRLGKRLSGTFTELGSPSGATGTSGDVIHCKCNGSTIEAILNTDSATHSVTDTSIVGNTRGGVACQNAGVLDNFQLADLAVSGIVYTQLERDIRGMNRGIWVGGIG